MQAKLKNNVQGSRGRGLNRDAKKYLCDIQGEKRDNKK